MATMGTTTGTAANPLDVIRTTVADMADKVYADPVRQDGVIVIPAATVGAGGGGGGGANGPEGTEAGGGGGFGLSAKPAGAFIIRDGKVRWRPVVDVNRVILGAQAVAVAALLVARAVILHRSRMARHRFPVGRRRSH
jgi:uncharacterized spore protein YtfJ